MGNKGFLKFKILLNVSISYIIITVRESTLNKQSLNVNIPSLADSRIFLKITLTEIQSNLKQNHVENSPMLLKNVFQN